jgi:hypothetical protein
VRSDVFAPDEISLRLIAAVVAVVPRNLVVLRKLVNPDISLLEKFGSKIK